MFENRNFMIFDLSEVNLVDFSEVLEDSEQTLRKSLDETKSLYIVKEEQCYV